MKNHICKYCQYWFAYPKANGECRRHAPAPVYSMTGDKPGQIWWPQTAPDFWCGDYEYGPSPQEKRPEDILEMSIDELDLSVRAHNALNNDYCNTIGDVVKRSRSDLLRLPNFGRGSLKDVEEALAQHDLKLPEESLYGTHLPAWVPKNI